MVKEKRKGALIMTNVLSNVENIIDEYDIDEYEGSSKKLSKIELILVYMKLKQAIKSNYAQTLIKKYIQKDKTIRSGKYIIKGTRISIDDIGRVLSIKNNMTVQDIMEQYPSLENKEQVMAGLMLYMEKNINLVKIIFT